MLHISFDFWNTVATANQEYGRQRSIMLANIFGTTPEIAQSVYKKVKHELDQQAENLGIDEGREKNILKLCVAFGMKADEGIIPLLIADRLNCLFADHPPIIEPELITALHEAKKRGITLSIGSNTAFINGRVLNKTIIGSLPFDFEVYSDNIGYSKPNPLFFEAILMLAKICNSDIRTTKDIVHIGDNPICDIDGASKAGMRTVRVQDARETVKAVNDLLMENV